MSILIYSEKKSPRLNYILDFIFNEVITCEYTLTTNASTFKSTNSVKINYSKKDLDTAFQIIPHSILFEQNFESHETTIFDWQGQQAFFKTSEQLIPFDIFAASFYLISRYEEYLEESKDEFGRFPHIKSLAFKEGFLNIPLVDNWLFALKKILLKVYPILKFKKNEFRFLPTYDIDIAFSYKHKGFLRNAGGALKDLSKGNLGALKQRIAVLQNKTKDPFDSFDFLDSLHIKNKLKPIYFVLLGSGGKYDKNLPPDQPAFQELIKQLDSKYSLGIHPSFRSNEEPKELKQEFDRLDKLVSGKTTKSRQHYIKFSLPSTYQQLIEQGIEEDYSMGYGSINGFRANTSSPFFWFDLSKNEITTLKVFPFCFMECNSFFEQKQSLAKTQIELKELVRAVKKVDGTFISIWHNFSLGSDPIWKDWSKLYAYQIDLCQE